MSDFSYEIYLKESILVAEKVGFRTSSFVSLENEDECLLAFEKECTRMLYEIPGSRIHKSQEDENDERCITFLAPSFRCWVAILKEDRSPYFGAILAR